MGARILEFDCLAWGFQFCHCLSMQSALQRTYYCNLCFKDFSLLFETAGSCSNFSQILIQRSLGVMNGGTYVLETSLHVRYRHSGTCLGLGFGFGTSQGLAPCTVWRTWMTKSKSTVFGAQHQDQGLSPWIKLRASNRLLNLPWSKCVCLSSSPQPTLTSAAGQTRTKLPQGKTR